MSKAVGLDSSYCQRRRGKVVEGGERAEGVGGGVEKGQEATSRQVGWLLGKGHWGPRARWAEARGLQGMRDILPSWPWESFPSRSVSDCPCPPPAQPGILAMSGAAQGGQAALGLELEGGSLSKGI